MDYRTYLASADWQQKREAKRTRKSGARDRCAICGTRDRLDVHHLRYAADLTTIQQADLRILCRRCHGLTHDLIRAGTLRFTKPDHHHRFALTKNAVKKALGLGGINCFK